ncbi:MAG TPA: nucleotide pyrophosphohydrolase [Rubrivivax sp.]|nr:nucleotide pyrophosphohydrolase [Rubrivivax sp.]
MATKYQVGTGMNLVGLQAELRHFAAERDWQTFHTPKNLSTALMVEAAELAEVFQWMTAEESQGAHQDPASKQRIGEEVADVLLYLLQVADHSQVDIAQAVKDKLARNALKYPSTRAVARVSPKRAAMPGTHVLLDYENVQPTEDELRSLVPDASQVWVFHGPHQRQVEQRFASFGADVTAVPISRPGKNALDFHLSFYMGYIASRNQASAIVVVANDKGYEPMLDHARAMGFAVRQQGYGKAKPAASAKTNPATDSAAKKVAAKNPPAKKAAAKQPAVKQVAAKKAVAKKAATTAAKKLPVKKVVTAKKVVPKPANPPAAKKAAAAAPLVAAKVSASVGAGAKAVLLSSDSVATIKKLSDNLRKMGGKRPTKPASLWRSLKSFLGAGATEESVEVALARLIEDGVVKVDSVKGASYPTFGPESGSAGTRV